MNEQTDSLDNELLNLLQSEFPISETPFLDLGHKLSISEDEVISRINKLKEITDFVPVEEPSHRHVRKDLDLL